MGDLVGDPGKKLLEHLKSLDGREKQPAAASSSLSTGILRMQLDTRKRGIVREKHFMGLLP
jgi:hypothetical protein